MRTTWIMIICLLCLATFFVGCIEGVDPNTGHTTYILDPNTGQAIQVGLDTVTTISGAGSVIAPQYAALFGLIGLVAGYVANLWRKLNPFLSQALTTAEIRQEVITAIAKAIENLGDSAQKTNVKNSVATNLNILELSEIGKAEISEAKTSGTANYLDTVIKPITTEQPK